MSLNSQYLRLLSFFIVNDSVTINELLAVEHVSERTMNKYIQQLNEELAGAAQVHEKRRRYYLQVNDYQRLAKLQTGHLKKSLDFNDANKRYAYIVKRLFQSTDYITLDDLADELTISKTTLNRDLKQLRQALASYDAEIYAMTNNGIKLMIYDDYEAPIIVDHFVYDYFDLQAMVTSEWLDRVRQCCYRLGLEASMSKLLRRHLIVLNFSINSGYRITSQIPNFHRLWQLSENPLQLATVLSIGFKTELSDNELDYLMAPLAFKANGLLSEALIDSQLTQNGIIFERIRQQSELSSALNFEHMYDQIKYHCLFLINRTIFHVQTNQLLPSNLLEKYPIAYDLAQTMLKVLEGHLGVPVDPAEMGYLVLYFEMELEDRQNKGQPSFEVAIVGQVGASVIKFIQHQLDEIFEDEVVVTVFANAKQLNMNYGHYLLIFSDRPIEYGDTTTPVVRISAAFRANELRVKLQVSLVERAILNSNCEFDFWNLKHQTPYLDAVKTMIEARIDDGSLNTSFMKSWQQREQQGSSVFENGIAIPHVIDNSGHQRILLQLGVFDRRTKYQDRDVQFVFLIGIPQKLNHELNKVLSQVYDLIFLIASNSNIYQGLLNYDQQQPLTQITEGI